MSIARRATDVADGLDVARALAIDALRLGRVLRDRSSWPATWAQPSFGAEVERYRRQMAGIRTRERLTASYGRDVVIPTRQGVRHPPASPIRVAYALRWLELLDGATGPSWPSLLS
jgi:hypothetical protein